MNIEGLVTNAGVFSSIFTKFLWEDTYERSNSELCENWVAGTMVRGVNYHNFRTPRIKKKLI